VPRLLFFMRTGYLL